MRKIGRAVVAIATAGLVFGTAFAVPAAGTNVTKAKSAKTTFVAEVPGTDAYLAIVLGKRSAVAYLCDSAQLDEWLTGAASNGVAALESETGSTLVAVRAGKKVRGTIVLADDRVLTFTATRATGKAGLFRQGRTVDGVTLAKGWVRLADGTTRGNGFVDNVKEFGQNVDEAVGGAVDNVQQQVADIVDKGQDAINQVAEKFGVLEPPQINVAPPVSGGVGSNGGDAAGASECPVFFFRLPNGLCALIPPFPVPEQPPAGAAAVTPPALDDTAAAQAIAEDADAVRLPAPDAFDAQACARIERGLALLADELDAIKAGSDTEAVFTSVFTHLRDRGTAGGCADLPEIL